MFIVFILFTDLFFSRILSI